MLEREYELPTSKRDAIIYSLLFLLSILFLIINSTSTSPFLFREYGDDSPIFMSMGKMFYSGAIPYIDFFDHKGPVIIFIQALGASLCKDVRNGMFVIQVLSLFFTTIVIYKTIRPSLSEKGSLIVIIFFLAFFSRFISAGNTTEEHCLFLSFLALYYAVKFVRDNSILSSVSYFVLGISFAFTFWIRANNSAVIVACLLYMFIVSVKNRNYNELKKQLLYTLLGIAALSLPIVLYFVYIGAFYEMIDAAFIVNFDYLLKANQDAGLDVATEDAVPLSYYVFVSSPFITLIMGTIVHYASYKNKDIIVLSVCLAIVCYVATLTGHPFLHYSILNLPCFVFGLFLLLYIFEQKYKQKYQFILLVLSVLTYLSFSAITLKNTLSASKEKERVLNQMIDQIPNEDHNSVFTYGVGAEFYLITDASPYCKYYILQEWQAEKLKRSSIFDEVNSAITQKPPRWIMINWRRDIKNTQLLDIVNTQYQLVKKVDKLELYKKKDI